MTGVLSMTSVAFGAAVAYLAERFPARSETLELVGGILLIAGLAFVGTALPVML